jgi:hypothetical protein
MGTVGICFVISLVLGFFCCLKKSQLYNMFDWLGNLFIFGIAGLFLGFAISVNLGNCISGEPVLTETRALEPIVVGSREIFLIKKYPSYYYYFIMGKRYGCVPEIKSTIKDVDFEDGVREERKYEQVFKNKRLHWLFFTRSGYIKVVVSSKEDIL